MRFEARYAEDPSPPSTVRSASDLEKRDTSKSETRLAATNRPRVSHAPAPPPRTHSGEVAHVLRACQTPRPLARRTRLQRRHPELQALQSRRTILPRVHPHR